MSVTASIVCYEREAVRKRRKEVRYWNPDLCKGGLYVLDGGPALGFPDIAIRRDRTTDPN